MAQSLSFTQVHLLSGMPASTPVLLALSGGADSRALLDMLSAYCKQNGARLAVAHVNHMIRGKDADRDSSFCEALAKEYGVPFHLLKADVPALAKQNKRGLEEEAREVRYSFFKKIMKQEGIPILATAHNATDNAETVLFNLTRGSGLKGLCGIPAVRDFEGGRIVRPILGMSKDEVLAYCEEKKLKYVTDATNDDVVYSRNKIRNNVIPELKSINPAVIDSITLACQRLLADEEFLQGEAERFIEALSSKDAVPLKELAKLDRAIASRVASSLLGAYFEVAAVHVDSFLELASRAVPHSELCFPKGCRVFIEDGSVNIGNEISKKDSVCFNRKISIGENRADGMDGVILAFSEADCEKYAEKENFLKNVYKNSTTAIINFDRINIGLFARQKQEGDKILSGGMHKKLKKLFCDKKLTLDRRAALPVICCQDEIIWVPTVALRDGEKNAENKLRLTFYYN